MSDPQLGSREINLLEFSACWEESCDCGAWMKIGLTREGLRELRRVLERRGGFTFVAIRVDKAERHVSAAAIREFNEYTGAGRRVIEGGKRDHPRGRWGAPRAPRGPRRGT
jgi:hypothetical protein